MKIQAHTQAAAVSKPQIERSSKMPSNEIARMPEKMAKANVSAKIHSSKVDRYA